MQDNEFKNREIKAVPLERQNIGVDTNNTFSDLILSSAEDGTLDKNNLQAFTQTATTREQIYNLIDTMSQDATISAILEIYSEDITDTNDNGEIIWCESDNAEVQKYVDYLIKNLRINDKIYSWAYNLVKYGDVYIRLYRDSDTLKSEHHKDKEKLNEDVILNIRRKKDKYNNYLDMVPNPGEMFELQSMGKTVTYIQAKSNFQQNIIKDTALNPYLTYKMNKNDVVIYNATDFAHASLQTSNDRYKEEISLVTNVENTDEEEKYTVKKGQSLLYNSFKTWRELDLLKNSLLLNRITRSAIVRLLSVDVGDMPDDKVITYLERIKSKITQKSAVSVGQQMQNYTDTQPIENFVLIAKHGEQGGVTQETLGGDVNIRDLGDIENFEDDLYGGLRVPKQFLGKTNDAAGFSGGESLSIISSRYGKSVKKYQKLLCQLVTDIINLYMFDSNKNKFINKFTIKMKPPVTQEDIDNRAAKKEQLSQITDTVQSLVEYFTDDELKLKFVKTMYAPVLGDTDAIAILDEQIKKDRKKYIQA